MPELPQEVAGRAGAAAHWQVLGSKEVAGKEVEVVRAKVVKVKVGLVMVEVQVMEVGGST
jgi:hypothetical protein